MAHLNYSKLSDKKLNALFETANDEQKALIEQELASRQAARAAQGQEYVDEEPLTPEQEKQLAEAEANGGGAKKPTKMTDEELEAAVMECRANIGHKCQVLPFNTPEWANGVITAVIAEKRSNKVMYTIKLDNGKKVSKIHGSNLLRILDEVVESVANKRTKATVTPWTDEDIEKAFAPVFQNVGKTVTFKNAEGTEETGRIISLVADRRSNSALYKIEQTIVDEAGNTTTKNFHKVIDSKGLVIAEEYDEVGKTMNEKFIARRTKKAAQDNSPEARVLRCEENLKAAQERLAKAQESLKKAEEALEAAKAEAAKAAEAPASEENLG